MGLGWVETWLSQTVDWVGAQFCIYMLLDSRDKSLNLLKFCLNDQRKWKNKKRTKERVLVKEPAYYSIRIYLIQIYPSFMKILAIVKGYFKAFILSVNHGQFSHVNILI